MDQSQDGPSRQKVLSTFKREQGQFGYYDKFGLADTLHEILNSTLIILSLICSLISWNIMTTPYDQLKTSAQRNMFIVATITQILINICFTFEFYQRMRLSFNVQQNDRFYLSRITFVIQFLGGPYTLILNIVELSYRGHISMTGLTLQSVQLFSMDFSIQIWKDLFKFIEKTQSIILTAVLMFVFLSHTAQFVYSQDPAYFSTFLWSSFTMLQFITLDDWDSPTEHIRVNFGPVSVFFTCTAVFLITYFYFMILMGIMIDTAKQNTQARNIRQLKVEYGLDFEPCSIFELDGLDDIDFEQGEEIQNQDGLFEKFFFGRIYQFLVITSVFLPYITDAMLHLLFHDDQNIIDDIILIITIINTFHFTVIIANKVEYIFMQKNEACKLELQSVTMLIFHTMSGPLALTFGILGSVNQHRLFYGSLFFYLKVFTTPSLKGVLRGTFHVFRFTWFIYVTIFNLMLIVSQIFEDFLSEPPVGQKYFSSFVRSLLTSCQLLFMDGWASTIAIGYQETDDLAGAGIILVIYVVIQNYLFLNIIVAITCESFQILVPKQKSLSRSIKLSAQKEIHNIVVLLTKLQVNVPFLDTTDIDEGEDNKTFAVHLIVDENTDQEMMLARKLAKIQNSFFNKQNQGKKNISEKVGKRVSEIQSDDVRKLGSMMVSKKKSIRKEAASHSDEFIKIFYKGITVKVSVNKVSIWGTIGFHFRKDSHAVSKSSSMMSMVNCQSLNSSTLVLD